MKYILDSIQRDIKTIQDNAAINNSVKQERIAQLNERLDAINKLYIPISKIIPFTGFPFIAFVVN